MTFSTASPTHRALTLDERDNSCGANQAVHRTKTSQCFSCLLLSTSFNRPVIWLERLYKAAYGNANGTSTFGGSHQLPVPIARFAEFLSDTQQIGQGVVVGRRLANHSGEQ